ncbi:MAG: hypothetical protein K8W52_17010 [Deltaproteobacteria bacterium]|nr:hypothetical protein [Deltaproteobacteria bacterium]
MKAVTGIAGGGSVMADDSKSIPDRIAGGVGMLGSGLGGMGSLLGGGLTTGMMGGMSMAEVGGTILAAGEAGGVGAGLGAAAVPAAAVLSAGAAGYGVGTLAGKGIDLYLNRAHTEDAADYQDGHTEDNPSWQSKMYDTLFGE